MGGHGGLNILPQKRWNVYNYDNREKVRRDEEAAAKEEQLKREQSRKRDSEFRLEQLRTARGLAPNDHPDPPAEPNPDVTPESDPGHINLFEGIRIFDQAPAGEKEKEKEAKKRKKVEPVVVTAEDEKYRVGYGLVGKGVKLPWYLEKRKSEGKEAEMENEGRPRKRSEASKGKKTVEEMREERLRREKREKERERALMRRK